MVILGLGSNLGDRLTYLRQALRMIRAIPYTVIQQVSPIYLSDALLPNHAPSTWNMPYLNVALSCETTLTPEALLQHTQQIEILLGSKSGKNWGPRTIDIDLLAWDDLVHHDQRLTLPHPYLHERPFALWPLADIAPFWV